MPALTLTLTCRSPTGGIIIIIIIINLQIADGRRTIKELEDKILKMLAEASGNILDDEVRSRPPRCARDCSMRSGARIIIFYF